MDLKVILGGLEVIFRRFVGDIEGLKVILGGFLS